MKIYVIDTNALISFVTDRSPDQQKRIAGIFESASRLRCTVVCPQHVLTEFVFVMDRVYRVTKEEINAMLADFIVMPGVEVVHDVDFQVLMSLWPTAIPDYGDAIVATVCKSIKGSVVITFDAKFLTAMEKAGIAVMGQSK
ncbi:MAG: PIN domain-containing protein [Geobacteraceae bacterium]|nr:PIN domain-containing protein [Geobacteraceae bacterium]